MSIKQNNDALMEWWYKKVFLMVDVNACGQNELHDENHQKKTSIRYGAKWNNIVKAIKTRHKIFWSPKTLHCFFIAKSWFHVWHILYYIFLMLGFHHHQWHSSFHGFIDSHFSTHYLWSITYLTIQVVYL